MGTAGRPHPKPTTAHRPCAVAYAGHGALGGGLEFTLTGLAPATAQSAATAIGPEGVGLRTRKHSGISATQIHAER